MSLLTRVGDTPPTKDAIPVANFSKYGKTFLRNSARHCNFAGDDCWHVRVHPKIDAISASAGYLTGGQQLEISGHGLKGSSISVTVDGEACAVDMDASDDSKIVCETGSKATPSIVDAY
jgi:hypothetical protein